MTAASLPRPSNAPPTGEQDVVSLLSVANLALRNRLLVVGTATILTVITILALLLWPRTYTAESSFMLQGRSSLPTNLTGLASQFGFALPTIEPNQSPAFYADLLQSREILSAVVDTPIELHVGSAEQAALLAQWFRIKASTPALQREKTIKKLRQAVAVSASTKTGVVALRITTRNPELSEKISARMLSWLNEFNLQKRQSQASAERRFTETRLDEARQELRDAEDRLVGFTQRNRDTRSSPLLTLEADRLTREVSMRQQVYTSVVQAYDRARIEEVRDTPVITVLQAPERPVRPDPRHLVAKAILALAVGLILGLWFAISRESFSSRATVERSPQSEFRALVSELLNDLRHPRQALSRRRDQATRTPA